MNVYFEQVRTALSDLLNALDQAKSYTEGEAHAYLDRLETKVESLVVKFDYDTREDDDR